MITWFQISSGVGPEECCYAAHKTMQEILKDAESKGFDAEIIDIEPSREDNILSCIIAIKDSTLEFDKSWNGIIQWVWKSTYRPDHKRKNWFIQVKLYNRVENDYTFLEKDVKFETARSSGKGGQNVNKTETMVRATHIPTGKTTVCRSERSQLMNKKTALLKLAMMIEDEKKLDKSICDKELRHSHYELERGNPIRKFQV
jgi:peptide chain release factor